MKTGHRFSSDLSTGAGRSNFNPPPSPGIRREAKELVVTHEAGPHKTGPRGKKNARNPWLDLVQRSRARNCETARPTIWFRGANAKRTAKQKAPVQGHGLVVAPARSASKNMIGAQIARGRAARLARSKQRIAGNGLVRARCLCYTNIRNC